MERPDRAAWLEALTALSASLPGGPERRWRDALRVAADVASPEEVEEVLLQSYLFVGFPVVLNALIVWRELSGEPPRASPDTPLADRRSAGEALCRRVYGKAYERLRENIAGLHPDIDRWMVDEGYGKTLSRPGLSPSVRELCVVALLAAGGHERQLRAHLRGAENVGAAPDEIERALWIGLAARRERRPEDVDRLAAVWASLRTRAEA